MYKEQEGNVKEQGERPIDNGLGYFGMAHRERGKSEEIVCRARSGDSVAVSYERIFLSNRIFRTFRTSLSCNTTHFYVITFLLALSYRKEHV